jgi:hypothetical protein
MLKHEIYKQEIELLYVKAGGSYYNLKQEIHIATRRYCSCPSPVVRYRLPTAHVPLPGLPNYPRIIPKYN